MHRISIIIPTYNEEKVISATLNKIIDYCERKGFDYEIIIVDDGSTDDTLAIAKKFSSPTSTLLSASTSTLLSAGTSNLLSVNKIKILENKVNRGKGYAVKCGALEAKKDWILFTDADLATPIEELENFSRFQNYDILIASRALAGSRILSHQPRFRELGGRFINFFVRWLAVPGIKDTQCGFKLFRSSAAKKIFEKLTIDRFGFDIEVLYIAHKYGFKIIELPVTWSHQPNTKVSPIKDGFRILWDLVKIKINDFRGLYR